MPPGFLGVLIIEGTALAGFLGAVRGAKNVRALQHLHYALLVVELACHTAIVYFLGGVSWLGAVAYIYALMYAVVFLSWRQAAVFTVAVVAAYLAVVSLDGTGVLPHQWYLPQGPDRYQNKEFLITTSIAFAGVLATITFWMVFLGNELRRERDFALRINAQMLGVQAELQQLNEELEKTVEERTRALTWRAEHDQLTGLLNRGAVSRRCNELLALARRGERPLAVIVADGDNFKVCNDEAGHAYGDEVIKALATCLRDTSRESDVVGRLGGDEFLVVLPDTSARGAVRFCRRVLQRLSANRQSWVRNGPAIPTLSMGIAIFSEHGSDMDELVRVADRAMYDAKAAGGARSALGTPGSAFAGPVPGPPISSR